MQISTVYPFEKDIPDIREIASAHPYSSYNSQSERRRELPAIVAMGRDRSIGFQGDMPWHIPEDLKHFKQLTTGHPVIMGRATWESLPKKPLPGRRNIVVTRQADYEAEGAEKAGSIEEAVAMCEIAEEPFIIGGASVYEQALPLLTRVYVTLVDGEFPEADRFFPELDPGEWEEGETEGPFESRCGLRYSFKTMRRKG